MRYLAIIAFGALTACAQSEQVNVSEDMDNIVVDNVVATPNAGSNPVGNAALSDPTAGGSAQWFARTRYGDQWAGYGPPNSEAAFSVRCNAAANRLIFHTIEMPPSGPGETILRLSAPGVDQSLTAEASEEGLPNTSASVATDAGWLARLATVSGNLTIRVGGSNPLVVPISTELTSLIRDCRR